MCLRTRKPWSTGAEEERWERRRRVDLDVNYRSPSSDIPKRELERKRVGEGGKGERERERESKGDGIAK